VSPSTNTPPLIAIATCTAFADLDPDDRLLLPALLSQGLKYEIAVWDDSTVHWDKFDLVLIRSTWDYSPRRNEFINWVNRISALTTVLNPIEVIEWSSDKHYLNDLAQAGVPIVPTSFFEIGDALVLPDDEFVIKPSISAGSRDTYRLSAAKHQEAQDALQSIHASGRSVMVQPYLKSVDTAAETALIFIDGHFSHAIRKGPLLQLDNAAQEFHGGLFIKEEITSRTATNNQLEVAHRALSVAPQGWLYARVDLIDDDQGNPVVLELEMVEPSLFFEVDADPSTGASGRLAQAIASRCSQ
jgi:glutathione synthase/RimK-type ligase-like ATP-grasp enzyme